MKKIIQNLKFPPKADHPLAGKTKTQKPLNYCFIVTLLHCFKRSIAMGQLNNETISISVLNFELWF